MRVSCNRLNRVLAIGSWGGQLVIRRRAERGERKLKREHRLFGSISVNAELKRERKDDQRRRFRGIVGGNEDDLR